VLPNANTNRANSVVFALDGVYIFIMLYF